MRHHVFCPSTFYNAIGLGDPVLTVDHGDVVPMTTTCPGRHYGRSRLSGRFCSTVTRVPKNSG